MGAQAEASGPDLRAGIGLDEIAAKGTIGGRVAIAVSVLGLAVAAFVWMADPLRHSAVPSVAQPASVAVLPFENLSAAEEHAYLADGTTEALIAALAQVRVIKVISRTSVMRFQGTDRPVPEIALPGGTEPPRSVVGPRHRRLP